MSKKKIAIGSFLGLLMVAVAVPLNVSAQDAGLYSGAESSVISPQATQYVWCYKTVNGKRYRRLWDLTNEKWVTDWILC